VAIPQLDNRFALLSQLDGLRRTVEQAGTEGLLDGWDIYRQQALRLLVASQPGRENPFDLSQETDTARDRYGREEWGQGFLTARRLIEAGVRMVQINLRGWDTHQNAFRDLKGKLLPSIDRCLSGFLDDLEERGLLDETLVVVMSEMGRTPKINGNAGRDHWTFCYSMWFAGAGIKGGTAYGASDAQAAYVKDLPVSTGDICATIFECLGIDPEMTVPDRSGRPMPIANGGHAIRDILT
jgi:hypothetical protein